jgi:hypothetical protein
MPLWCKSEISHKLRIAIKRSNGFYNVPAVELEVLIRVSNDEFLALEWRAPGQFVVDYLVQPFDSAI